MFSIKKKIIRSQLQQNNSTDDVQLYGSTIKYNVSEMYQKTYEILFLKKWDHLQLLAIHSINVETLLQNCRHPVNEIGTPEGAFI